MIGWSKMGERLPEMTPNGMLLDVSLSAKKILFKKDKILLMLIRLKWCKVNV
jgi:hypothetical protein